jgi:hypothetical protein
MAQTGQRHAFGDESGAVISPHPLCSRGRRVCVYSAGRDALRLGQADRPVSSTLRVAKCVPRFAPRFAWKLNMKGKNYYGPTS